MKKQNKFKIPKWIASRIRKSDREWSKLSPSERAKRIEEGMERLQADLAPLRAKAAELPRLRAEAERLEARVQDFDFRVAQLAAQINPKLFEESPEMAIRLALKRLRDTRRIIHEIGLENEEKQKKAQAEAEKDHLAKTEIPFQRAVKLITDDKNWDRARDKFRRFLAAKHTKEGEAQAWLEDHRNGKLTGEEVIKLIREYTPWWKQEKSNRAKKSALANKRRGRVKRPQSDLRFKENRKHTQGYCRKCGKRVKDGQKLCDEHITSKVLTFGSAGLRGDDPDGKGAFDLAILEDPKTPGDPRKHGVIPII